MSDEFTTGLLTSNSNQHKDPVTGVVKLVPLKKLRPKQGAGSSRFKHAVMQSVNVST